VKAAGGLGPASCSRRTHAAITGLGLTLRIGRKGYYEAMTFDDLKSSLSGAEPPDGLMPRCCRAGRDRHSRRLPGRLTQATPRSFAVELISALLAGGVVLWTGALGAEPVSVRYPEGLVHGFLSLKTLEGSLLADGDLLQVARGVRVTSRLVFHFKDGSVHDETAVFSQRRQFRLVSDRLVQKGPSFPRPLEMSVDAGGGQVTVRYTDDRAQPRVESKRLDLPADLANGLILTLLKNARSGAPLRQVSLVIADPKPRLVKLGITATGEDAFTVAGAGRHAMHYVLKVQIGGISGVLAPLVGKQPPDSHVWILGGEAPAFVRSEQPLYAGGPLWRIELVGPVWPHTASSK
jgi:hypothetical protein